MPAEAINAATLNGACAMGLSENYGSITRGKVANFFITAPIPSIEFIPYAEMDKRGYSYLKYLIK